MRSSNIVKYKKHGLIYKYCQLVIVLVSPNSQTSIYSMLKKKKGYISETYIETKNLLTLIVRNQRN